MRRNITVSLDDAFIQLMDAKRGAMPRSRWLETAADPQGGAPVLERSPGPRPDFEEPREVDEVPMDKWGNPVGTSYDEDDPRSWT